MKEKTLIKEGFSNQRWSGDDIPAVENLIGVRGFNRITQQRNALNTIRVAEAARLWKDVVLGGEDPYLLLQAFNPTSSIAFEHLCKRCPNVFNESVTTSDFGSLTDQVINRMVLEGYDSYPVTYPLVAKVSDNVRDFRAHRRYTKEGMRTVLDKVHEKAGFNRRAGSQAYYEMTVDKYEAGFEISWEAMINDDIDYFGDWPQRLVEATHNTVELAVTNLYVGTAGPDATFYSVGNDNIIASNPALSLVGLQAGFAKLLDRTDSEGVPISIDTATLVVGSGALWVIAQNLKNQLSADIGGISPGLVGAANQDNKVTVRVNNWLIQKFDIVFNPWISQVADTNAATSWWLFAKPTRRPALEVAFLQGYRKPALYRKVANTMRIGGGIDQAHGDFETMSNETKVMTVFGTKQADPKLTVASNGTGS